jgi:hypothetical protein
VAILAHLMALLALGWRAPELVERQEADLVPSMQVALVRPPRAVPPALPTIRQAPARSQAPSPPRLPPPAPAANLLPPVLTQPAPAAAQPEAAPNGQPFRNALRGLVGCSDPSAYHLSREERAACDQRLAAAKPAPVGPEHSAEALAQYNADKQDPILIRKTHNGCLPHLGDRPADAAASARRSGSTTTYGLSCSWSF